ncbi:response regulator [uncultured Sphingosinicella sp.]|uniref:response regulator transcription factor n=1 Tax=uncultured Sphingosinicella sp. TaxID=478748 RepID=UPI0030DB78A9|tara:strand:- start:38476 stop:39210 length:735 start_codon:yes stop_codon:yes gene_type:complete
MGVSMTVNAGDRNGCRILVVDDVEANRSVVCRRLERLNYTVVSADSGEAALQLIEKSPPDLVLLDYMMPNMNGIDVLRELRTNSRVSEVPVIMLTARADAQTVVASLEAGADDYVSKPIDFDVLSARIEAQLQRRQHAANLKLANAKLDERVTRRAIELSELEEQLELESEQRRVLQSEVERLIADRKAVLSTGVNPDLIEQPLQRIAQIADSLADPGRADMPVNPAAIAEIAALARQALGSVR